MTNIKFSTTSQASAATSIAVGLGGTPSVGDLVLVALGADNEIVTQQPGFNGNTQWYQLNSFRSPFDTGNTFTVWAHTWNASDTGSSVTFNFVPAPTIGVGDKDLPSTNALAIGITLDGGTTPAWLENSVAGLDSDWLYINNHSTIKPPPLRIAADLGVSIGYAVGVASFTNSDGTATLQQSVTNSSGNGQTMSLYTRASTPAGYVPTLTFQGRGTVVGASVSVRDNGTLKYLPPFLQEAPAGDGPLFFRYSPPRHYTILNNSGVFTAVRYPTQDDLAAATAYYLNDAVVSTTERTNILNAGVGGEFRATA